MQNFFGTLRRKARQRQKKRQIIMVKKIIKFSIFAILIVSNILLIRSLLIAYSKFNTLRLNPIGNEIKFDGGNYSTVLIGDSHVANWNFNDQNVLNLGIPSQTSSQILLRSNLYKGNFSGNRLILTIGCNDIRSLATNKKERDKIVEQLIVNIEKIIGNHKNSFEKIYVSTIPPLFSPPFPYNLIYDKSVYSSLDSANLKIKNICISDSKLILLDIYNLLYNNKQEMTFDGIHMNSKAYKILENEINKKEFKN